MKRLRHPVRAIREPFGTAGLIVACVALVLALTGAAFAAGGLTGKQKKEVEKIAKKFAGKPGAMGPAGANGSNGTNGKDGAPGAKGEDGTDGTDGTDGIDGTDGEDGKSVESAEIQADPSEPTCDGQGGAVYNVEGSAVETTVCNGKEGSPWTDNGTLPSGATETGVWAITGQAGGPEIWAPLSFPVPYPSAIAETAVHFSSDSDFSTFCQGITAAPEAEAGQLCVYLNPQQTLTGTTYDGIYKLASANNKGANRPGAVIRFTAPTGPVAASGTFAVQGPAPAP
jgi:Collagen triple helix repeat (20 copies)